MLCVDRQEERTCAGDRVATFPNSTGTPVLQPHVLISSAEGVGLARGVSAVAQESGMSHLLYMCVSIWLCQGCL
jgi:hypothetical protein